VQNFNKQFGGINYMIIVQKGYQTKVNFYVDKEYNPDPNSYQNIVVEDARSVEEAKSKALEAAIANYPPSGTAVSGTLKEVEVIVYPNIDYVVACEDASGNVRTETFRFRDKAIQRDVAKQAFLAMIKDKKIDVNTLKITSLTEVTVTD
jgi:hypothetical protein